MAYYIYSDNILANQRVFDSKVAAEGFIYSIMEAFNIGDKFVIVKIDRTEYEITCVKNDTSFKHLQTIAREE